MVAQVITHRPLPERGGENAAQFVGALSPYLGIHSAVVIGFPPKGAGRMLSNFLVVFFLLQQRDRVSSNGAVTERGGRSQQGGEDKIEIRSKKSRVENPNLLSVVECKGTPLEG